MDIESSVGPVHSAWDPLCTGPTGSCVHVLLVKKKNQQKKNANANTVMISLCTGPTGSCVHVLLVLKKKIKKKNANANVGIILIQTAP